MKDIKVEAERVVKEAGKLFFEKVTEGDVNEKKGTANFVTSVDLAVQDFVVRELECLLPGSNIITEESSSNLFHMERPTWILDPVDGTTNLMYDYRHSAVSLALLIEGKPVLGMVYNPFLQEFFWGEKGKGAFLNEKSMKVSSSRKLSDSLVAFGTTPYDRSEAARTFEITRDVFSNSRDVRRSGSAALDMAYVACGRLDGFYELSLQPWDYAAGIILLEEAGGRVTNWAGRGLSCTAADSVAATNGDIHEELRNLLMK